MTKRPGRFIGTLLKDPLIADKMVLLSGPRQVGKTTLAKKWLVEGGNSSLYFNWDDESIRRAYHKDAKFFESAARNTGKKPKVVFDEIHKIPNWKTLLKGYYDTLSFRFLVTGSARLEMFQRSGDSMIGRYHLLHLWPLIVAELEGKAKKPILDFARDDPFQKRFSQDIIETLLEFGGFPEPFFKQNKRAFNLWQREYTQRILREDLKDLTKIGDLVRAEHLMELLPHRVGSPLSLNSLREDLLCSHDAVQALVRAFEKLFITFTIRPYSKKIRYALTKGPKVYFVDWSRVPDSGYRFENFMAIQLKAYCDYVTDGGWVQMELWYVRDKQKREVDFLITRDGKPLLLVEAKNSESQPDPSLVHYSQTLKDVLAVQVVRTPGTFVRKEKNLWIISAERFFGLLWE